MSGDGGPQRPDLHRGADGARHSTHTPFSLSDAEGVEDGWDLSLIHDAVAFDDVEDGADDE
jgi:hypothetical protein